MFNTEGQTTVALEKVAKKWLNNVEFLSSDFICENNIHAQHYSGFDYFAQFYEGSRFQAQGLG